MHKILPLFVFLLIQQSVNAWIPQTPFPTDSTKIIFEAYGKKGIKDESGEIILPAKYEALTWNSNPNSISINTVTPYKKNGYWGLLNAEFKEITEAKYIALIPFTENLLIAAVKGKYSQTIFYGLIGTGGELKLAFKYRNLIPAGEFIIAANKTNQSINYGILDKKGKEILPFSYYQIKYLGSKYFSLTDEEGITSIVSENGIGTKVIDQIDSASIFKGDLAVIYKLGRVGMLHVSGKLVLPIKYKKIERNDGKVVHVTSFKEWKVLDNKGNLQYEFTSDSVIMLDKDHVILSQNGKSYLKALPIKEDSLVSLGGLFLESWHNYYLVKKDGITRLVDSTNLISSLSFGEFIDSNEDFIIFRSREYGGNAYTVVNKSGKQLKVESFSLEGKKLIAQSGAYWGLYDAAFEEVISPIYDALEKGSPGQYIVKFRGDLGVIDQEQKWVVSPEMLQIKLLPNGKYWLVNKFLSEFIVEPKDTSFKADYQFLIKGDKLYETTYDGFIRLLGIDVNPLMKFVKGTFYAEHENGFLIKNQKEFSYYNYQGDFQFKTDGYDSIGLLNDDFLSVKKGESFGFIDLNGKLRIANRYDDILPFQEGKAAVKINNKWGFVTFDEELIIQPYYDQVQSFNHDKAIVKIKGKYGLIDNKGKSLIDIVYDSICLIENNYFFKKDGMWGYADNEGNVLRYPSYNSIRVLNDFLLVEKYNQFELLNSQGTDLLGSRYHAVYYDPTFNQYLVYKKGNKHVTFLSDLKNGLNP